MNLLNTISDPHASRSLAWFLSWSNIFPRPPLRSPCFDSLGNNQRGTLAITQLSSRSLLCPSLLGFHPPPKTSLLVHWLSPFPWFPVSPLPLSHSSSQVLGKCIQARSPVLSSTSPHVLYWTHMSLTAAAKYYWVNASKPKQVQQLQFVQCSVLHTYVSHSRSKVADKCIQAKTCAPPDLQHTVLLFRFHGAHVQYISFKKVMQWSVVCDVTT